MYMYWLNILKGTDMMIDIDNTKRVYRPGDELKGKLNFYLKDSINVKKVSFSLHGATLTRLSNTEPKADDNIWFEDITAQENVLFPADDIKEDTVKLPHGNHEFNFSFKIPTGKLPSSFEGKYGAIRYWFSFDIKRSALRSHIRQTLVFTVLDNIDVNLPQYSQRVARNTEKIVTETLGTGGQGVVTLFAETDRGAYCPGEKIFIKYLAENKSDIDLGHVSIELMQEVKFRAVGEEKYTYKCIKKITEGEMKKGVTRTSLDEKLFILVPAIPPSTRDGSCHVIVVKYYLKVMIDIPKTHGGDSTIELPVTIGTIPQGTGVEVQGASNIHAETGESAFTYFMYEDGFEDGSSVWSSKLNFNFPKLPYVPYCPYVFDFVRPEARETASITNPATALANPSIAISSTFENNLANILGQTDDNSTLHNIPHVHATAALTSPPPTYEEVLIDLELETFSGHNLDENSGTQGQMTNIAELKSGDKKGIAESFDTQAVMIIRFHDICFKQFRMKLKENCEKLVQLGGEVVALAPQVHIVKGTWPAHISVAVLKFKTFEGGSDWFKGFKKCCEVSAVDIVDCGMVNAFHGDSHDKNMFSLHVVQGSGDLSGDVIKKVTKRVTDQITLNPARFGGKLISTGKVQSMSEKHVSESTWHIITLCQWASKQQINEYRYTLQGKFKDFISSLGYSYKTEDLVIFQSENVFDEQLIF